MCRFSAAGMTVSPRTPTAGGRKAPRQEIAGWERRWCRNYGDFAAGAGVDVAERGGKVRNFATRQGRELGCERDTDRLCNAILRFWVSPKGNIDVTTQGTTLSAGSQHRHWAGSKHLYPRDRSPRVLSTIYILLTALRDEGYLPRVYREAI